jgi:hypothetical protein
VSYSNLLVEAQPAVTPDKNLTRTGSEVSVRRTKVLPIGHPPTGEPKEGGSGSRRRSRRAPIPSSSPRNEPVQGGMVVYSSVWYKVL